MGDLLRAVKLLLEQTRLIPDRENGGIIAILPTRIYLEIEDLLETIARKEHEQPQ